MQLAPAPSDVPQAPLLEKLRLTATPLIDTVFAPEFFKLTVCAALSTRMSSVGKNTLSGVAATLGGVLAPVPFSATVSGAVLPVTVRAPASTPTSVGVKVTLIMQLVCGASAAPQLLV